MISLYFDGGCLPKNPGGIATFGFIIYDSHGVILKSDYGIAGTGKGMTNNMAEYHALYSGLSEIRKSFPDEKKVTVYGDSQMVIKMVTRQWGYKSGIYAPHPKHPQLRAYLEDIHKLILQLDICNLNWIPRENNQVADALTDKAYKEYKLQKTQATNEKAVKPSKIVEHLIESLKQYPAINIKSRKEFDIDMRPYEVITFRAGRVRYKIAFQSIHKNGA